MSSDADERARLKALVEGDDLGTKRHCAAKPPSASSDPRRPLPQKTQKRRGITAMEPTGIEPVTSCLQSVRPARAPFSVPAPVPQTRGAR
jgi:hypothetical protein